jgi:hypothetical protein
MNSMNRSTTRATFVVALAMACFLLPPNARAISPPPDGGYPGGNTATGNAALFNNDGSNNTANGADALFANTTGFNNTAMGNGALSTNISGRINTAIGRGALTSNTSGDDNTAVGNGALAGNNTGNFNIAVGNGALGSNTQHREHRLRFQGWRRTHHW